MSKVNDFAVNDYATKYLGTKSVVYYNNTFWIWDGRAYPAATVEEVGFGLRLWLVEQGIEPTIGKVLNLREQIAARSQAGRGLTMPAWLGAGDDLPDPRLLVNFRNGLLNTSTGELTPHRLDYFSSGSLPFDYDPEAACPKWLKFLQESLIDEDQIDLARQWLGYNLVIDNRYQKFMLLHGPTGGGKGVFMRMLAAILGGFGKVGAVSLQGLSGGFGLENLVGKQAAIVSEIELGRDSKYLVQVLKAITGNDPVEINRKYQAAYSGLLPVRLTVSANRLPRLPDASNALAARMLVLCFPNSYRGTEKENPFLEDELAPEVQSVANWAIGGLLALRQAGRFVQPERGKEADRGFRELAAPVLGFVDEWCEVGGDKWASTDDLYRCWCLFCGHDGHEAGSKIGFIHNLKAAFPTLKRAKAKFGLCPTSGDEVVRQWGYLGIGLNQRGKNVVFDDLKGVFRR